MTGDTKTATIKFDILNRWTSAVQFTAEIKCAPDEMPSVKLGLAVKWAIKSGANLSGANLSGAYLSGSNLSNANLRDAYLSGANFRGANLSDANFRDANFRGANFRGANLSDANFRDANFRGADLRGADLRGANLRGANLSGADLRDAKDADLAIAKTRILPDGDLVGWKKCKYDVIVKLRIPEAAKRSHAFGRKCRAEYVQVIEVIGAAVGISRYDGETEYSAGAVVKPNLFDENWINECSNGIHFYISRIEAEKNY